MINQLLIFTTLAISLLNGLQIEKIDSYQKAEGNQIDFKSTTGKLRVSVYNENILRVQAIANGEFQEPKLPIVVAGAVQATESNVDDRYDHYLVTAGKVGIKVYKNPVRLAMVDRDNRVLWEETQPLQFGNSTIQTLKQFENEQFFGGGMQNGRFSHRGKKINITVDYNWEDNGNPNPAPFYMSTKGYGVFRNTFSPGNYDFGSPAKLTHEEDRFDAYYFYGPSLKNILNHYTQLTGRPFMPPMYGIEMGDADCYSDRKHNNLPNRDTLTDATKVAQGYVDNDMPVGWMLVNDGYGCGYTRLGETNRALLDRNVTLGLWTQSDLVNQPTEVGQWGVRVRKLDVAWVGDGYEFAFNACQVAYNGIQDNSDARGFVWLVEGWAGSQKCAVMWTGDQSGNWENIRFHIPTIHGSGLSSQVWVAGDIDGIFGGSSETYIRDLQYRVFTPVFMTMSGWAKFDKQPWRRGEPGTSINRKYLKLREQLLPYIYSYAHQAHTTGLPVARSLVLEYPQDSKTWDSETTKYQYLFGEHFLVAPVYTPTTVRNGIYLPKGTWFDYWTTKSYQGEQTINGYEAPLDRIPLLVRGGAIIPMWPELNSFRQRKPNGKLILDLYPDFATTKTTEFDLYEDDMVTRGYESGKYALQKLTLRTENHQRVTVTVGKLDGAFDGKSTQRPYDLKFRIKESVKKAVLELDGGNKEVRFNQKDGTVTLGLEAISTDKAFKVTLHL